MKKQPSFAREVLNGKSIGRILLNEEIHKAGSTLSGEGLDLAGGSGSYYRYLPDGLAIHKTNYQGGELDTVVDVNLPLPFAEASFDFAIFFSALYIVENPEKTLSEIYRVLRPGGRLILSTPFIANEMPEPHDYVRFTYEGLERLFRSTLWKVWEIRRVGDRFASAASLVGGVFPRFLRVPAYALALGLDKLLPASIRAAHPTPILYFCILEK